MSDQNLKIPVNVLVDFTKASMLAMGASAEDAQSLLM